MEVPNEGPKEEKETQESEEEDLPVDNIDRLLEQAGCGSKKTPLGKYQKICVFLLIFTMNTQGFFFYGLPFWEKIPKY